MPKKIFSVLCVLALMVSLSACGGAKKENQVNISVDEAFNKIWSLYSEEEKFPVMGGDIANASSEGPALYSLSEIDGLSFIFYIPAEKIEKIDSMASMVHMMNSNTFTGAVIKLSDASELDAFVATLKSSLDMVQWMCGAPDKLIICKLSDDVLVYAFGEGTIIEAFKAKVAEAFKDSTVITEEDITFDF